MQRVTPPGDDGEGREMEITEVKVFPIQEEKLKAFVSIVFDQCFMVNDIKIIQGREGLFISMPSRKKKNGEFKDVAHPLNNETRRMIEEKVLGEYHRVLAERGDEPAVSMSAGEESEVRESLAAAPVPSAVAPLGEKSMEEVQEMHLRDSFWTVP
jgi:stage V sporulation protein G